MLWPGSDTIFTHMLNFGSYGEALSYSHICDCCICYGTAHSLNWKVVH